MSTDGSDDEPDCDWLPDPDEVYGKKSEDESDTNDGISIEKKENNVNRQAVFSNSSFVGIFKLIPPTPKPCQKFYYVLTITFYFLASNESGSLPKRNILK